MAVVVLRVSIINNYINASLRVLKERHLVHLFVFVSKQYKQTLIYFTFIVFFSLFFVCLFLIQINVNFYTFWHVLD